ncbi:MAG: aminopeptidase P family protein [bacterium]|nr:aminopeptidase P family protein [bacterium]
MDIVKEKIEQAGALLKEMDLDMWLVFVRETSLQADPVVPLVIGDDATWASFFIYTRDGDALALVGNFDEDVFKRSGRFTEVLTYTQSARQEIVQLLNRFAPSRIALNFSTSDSASDGLTHGMYLLLQDYLAGTSYSERLTSAENFCSRLRSRKTDLEVKRLTVAAEMAHDVWSEIVGQVTVGMSEIEVARMIDARIRDAGGEPSFDTIVNAGDKTNPGHGHPTDAVLEKGDLLHVDFGVICEDFCSDIQRLLYFRRPDEKQLPAELTEAFALVNEIIETSSRLCLPGTKGYEVDSEARRTLTENGFPEYQHALGHQLGRAVHDGGGIIGPRWERYGVTPSIELETGNVFTLELEIMLPGIGCVGLEEDICVTPDGGHFLSPRQLELNVI